MSRLFIPNRWALLVLLLMPFALWWLPVLRSVRFCDYTAKLSDEGGFYEDWAYARSLRAEYLIAAAVSLAYAVASVWLGSRLLLVLCCTQWLAAVYIIRARPEELYAIVPPLLPSFVLLGFWCFGGYLVCHIVYHLVTPSRSRTAY